MGLVELELGLIALGVLGQLLLLQAHQRIFLIALHLRLHLLDLLVVLGGFHRHHGLALRRPDGGDVCHHGHWSASMS